MKPISGPESKMIYQVKRQPRGLLVDSAVESQNKQERREFLLKGSRTLAGLSYASLVGSTVLGGVLASGCATEEKVVAKNSEPVSHPLQGLTTLKGTPFELPQLLGRVTLLDFWASWCAPCRQAFRYLDQLYVSHLADGLQMVAICLDEEAEEGQRFVNRMRVRFPIAWDAQQSVKARFAVQNLPTTFLLDEKGRLVHRHSGFDVRSHRVLEEQVRRLVKGQ